MIDIYAFIEKTVVSPLSAKKGGKTTLVFEQLNTLCVCVCASSPCPPSKSPQFNYSKLIRKRMDN